MAPGPGKVIVSLDQKCERTLYTGFFTFWLRLCLVDYLHLFLYVLIAYLLLFHIMCCIRFAKFWLLDSCYGHVNHLCLVAHLFLFYFIFFCLVNFTEISTTVIQWGGLAWCKTRFNSLFFFKKCLYQVRNMTIVFNTFRLLTWSSNFSRFCRF